MLNDYLKTVFDDEVTSSLCRSCRNTALPWYPREKPQLAAILSLHVERLSFQEERNNTICTEIAPWNRNTFTWIVRRTMVVLFHNFKVSGLCNWVCPLQQKHHPNHIGLWIIFQKGKDVNASYNVPYLSKIPRLLLWKILQHLLCWQPLKQLSPFCLSLLLASLINISTSLFSCELVTCVLHCSESSSNLRSLESSWPSKETVLCMGNSPGSLATVVLSLHWKDKSRVKLLCCFVW